MVTKYVEGYGNVEFDSDDEYTNYLRENNQPVMTVDTVSPTNVQLKNTESKYSDELRQKADVQQILNVLNASQKAKVLLDEISEAKKNTRTGPYYSNVFDADVPVADDKSFMAKTKGSFTAPLDATIRLLAPKRVQNIRMLNQALTDLNNYLATTAGKAISGPEIALTMPKFPNLYEEDETFDTILNKARKNMGRDEQMQIQILRNLGYPDADLQKLTTPLTPIDIGKLKESLQKRGVQ